MKNNNKLEKQKQLEKALRENLLRRKQNKNNLTKNNKKKV